MWRPKNMIDGFDPLFPDLLATSGVVFESKNPLKYFAFLTAEFPMRLRECAATSPLSNADGTYAPSEPSESTMISGTFVQRSARIQQHL